VKDESFEQPARHVDGDESHASLPPLALSAFVLCFLLGCSCH